MKMGTVVELVAVDPRLVPPVIPIGAEVEILKTVQHKDFFSGTGYVIYWPEKAYSAAVNKDMVRLH